MFGVIDLSVVARCGLILCFGWLIHSFIDCSCLSSRAAPHTSNLFVGSRDGHDGSPLVHFILYSISQSFPSEIIGGQLGFDWIDLDWIALDWIALA